MSAKPYSEQERPVFPEIIHGDGIRLCQDAPDLFDTLTKMPDKNILAGLVAQWGFPPTDGADYIEAYRDREYYGNDWAPYIKSLQQQERSFYAACYWIIDNKTETPVGFSSIYEVPSLRLHEVSCRIFPEYRGNRFSTANYKALAHAALDLGIPFIIAETNLYDLRSARSLGSAGFALCGQGLCRVPSATHQRPTNRFIFPRHTPWPSSYP